MFINIYVIFNVSSLKNLLKIVNKYAFKIMLSSVHRF